MATPLSLVRPVLVPLALALLAGRPALAADPPDSGGKVHGSMLDRMDANGDGKVTRAEHAAAAKAMFEAMDADKDGKVTAAEMEAGHAKATGQKAAKGELSAAEKLKTVDANGDGVLTAEEHAAASERMFDAMDTDHDGSLSKAELSAGHEKLMHHGKK
ncbi:MAG: EF-hand domain-containing protein [Anaeromyxobacteraceae bacterium]